MDGIVLINKEKGITSRDVVNQVSKKLNTKKVGHTGTLDPLATGLLVLGVNKGCKLVELLQGHDKEYIAKVRIGFQTDTFDITGKIVWKEENYSLTRQQLNDTLESFIGEYNQTVPIYSSIKVNGKKLYEYARKNVSIELPSRLVKIYQIRLMEYNHDNFTFSVSVSSGTYIRSLINDIGKKLKIPMTMEELERVKIGDYELKDATNVDNLKVIPIIDALNIKKIEVNDILLKKVFNGVRITNTFDTDLVMFTNKQKVIAIYKDIGNNIMQSYRVFKN